MNNSITQLRLKEITSYFLPTDFWYKAFALYHTISSFLYWTLTNNQKLRNDLLNYIYYILRNKQFATKSYQAQCGTNAKNFSLHGKCKEKSHSYMSMRASPRKCTFSLMRLYITKSVHFSHVATKITLKFKCL